jgi:amino acid permease
MMRTDVVVSSIVLGYWSGGASVPIAAWLCVFLAAILVINFLGVR